MTSRSADRPDEDQATKLRRDLVQRLISSNRLRTRQWREAFESVPRHAFVPAFFSDPRHRGEYTRIEAQDPASRDAWLRAVYSDDALITQLNGPAGPGAAQPPAAGTAMPTSSSTAPGLMALMLEALNISDGMKVLEIGTGTGYNAALLCERLGSDLVTSIDIDPELVAAAGARLRALGYTPRLEAADGMAGYPPSAPYSRIIATVGVPQIPRAWIAQTAGNGRILANVYRQLGGGALALLTVRDGRAEGRFLPNYGGFMPVRQLRRPGEIALVRAARQTDSSQRDTSVTGRVLDDEPFAFFAALLIPAQRIAIHHQSKPAEFWLLATDGSWACQTTDQSGTPTVNQHGPLHLWDDLEHAHSTWTALGAPARQDFGLTVAEDGTHMLWNMRQPAVTWPLTHP